MDATDASFAKFMAVAVDLPSRGVPCGAPPMERASLDRPSELFQACILKRARATTCGDKPASELGNGVFLVADSRIPNHTLYASIPNHTL